MNARDRKIKLGVLAMAVQGALAAMCAAMPAWADDAQEAALKMPTNSVEFGGLSVSKDSAKFGEYTGLNKSGGYVIGNVDIRGGNAYGDGGGTMRWSIFGADLGLTSRSLGATVAEQGRWNLGINFDQLTHYTADTYQTPYLGGMGGNSFVLPGGFAAANPNTRLLTAAQRSAFQTVDINNSRDNTSFTGGFHFNEQWSFKFDYNHLDQSGSKLMGFASAGIGTVLGEKTSILPMTTDSKTDMVNASMNWIGEKGHATASYFGSFYRDSYSGVTFQTFAGAGAPSTQTMSTNPSNNFNQLNLTGGYAFNSRTKLAGGLSYGRNTQNASYGGSVDAFMMTTPPPVSSLGGSVVSTHADIKLTDQTTRNLGLSAAFKYDDRDNRTSSRAYNFHAIDGLTHDANYPNPAYHIKKSQLELAGDYRFSASQKLRLAYTHDDIDRKCDNYAVIAPSIISGNLNTYPSGTNCLTATGTKEDKFGATWRLRAAEAWNFDAGYQYSDRKTTFDQNAIAPFIGTDGNPNLAAPAATLIRGLNAAEYRGFHPFFDASRTQQMLKAGANWQATERLSLLAKGRIAQDDYDTPYGMQKGGTQGLSFDATYQYREGGNVTAYVTGQERTRDMTNLQRSPTLAGVAASPTAVALPSGGTWTNKMKDSDTTFGIALRQDGLMAGKLDILGDALYSFGKTSYNTGLNYSTVTSGGLTCADPSIFTCVGLPDIKSTMTQFKLTGNYRIDKSGKVSVGYLYRRLKNDDFYYNGLQNGFTPTSVLPTNQQPLNYNVNVIWASYTYTFQ